MSQRIGDIDVLRGCAVLMVGVVALMLLARPARGFYLHEVSQVAVISIVLVWLASYDQGIFLRFPPVRAAMLWIGSRSYAIYLIHVPTYLFVRELQYRLLGSSEITSTTHLAVAWPAAWLLTALLAELNFRFVESPLRRFGVRLTSASRAYRGDKRAIPTVEPASNS